MKNKNQYSIEVLYLGEKVDVLGGIKKVFRDKTGRQYNYAGVKNVYFGESYLVSEDGYIATEPEKVENQTLKPTEEEYFQYEANKEICKHQRLKKRKALEIKKPHPDITRAIGLPSPEKEA